MKLPDPRLGYIIFYAGRLPRSTSDSAGKAMKTLPTFQAALRSNCPANKNFSLMIEPDQRAADWYVRVQQDCDEFRGYRVNSDGSLAGKSRKIITREIRDWAYTYNNQLRGGYTLRRLPINSAKCQFLRCCFLINDTQSNTLIQKLVDKIGERDLAGIKVLLENGANPNTPANCPVYRGEFELQCIPVLTYCLDEKYLDPVPWLLAAGADANAMDEIGRKPIYFCALYDLGHEAELLINNGASIDSTAIRLVINNKSKHVARILYNAAQSGLVSTRELFSRLDKDFMFTDVKVADLFLKLGFPWEKVCLTGKTTAMEILESGKRVEFIEWVLRNRTRVLRPALSDADLEKLIASMNRLSDSERSYLKGVLPESS